MILKKGMNSGKLVAKKPKPISLHMFNTEQMYRIDVNHKNISLAKSAILCHTFGIFQVFQ